MLIANLADPAGAVMDVAESPPSGGPRGPSRASKAQIRSHRDEGVDDWTRVLGRAKNRVAALRLRTLIGDVLTSLPKEVPPLRSVSEVRTRRRATRGTVGLTTYRSAEPNSAGVLKAAGHGAQTITFYSELLDRLSDDAAKGVIVHELAHAWLNEHVSPQSSRRREAEADELARSWGYGGYLAALDAEATSV
jgi:Zn-dependent protease with chaperone function